MMQLSNGESGIFEIIRSIDALAYIIPKNINTLIAESYSKEMREELWEKGPSFEIFYDEHSDTSIISYHRVAFMSTVADSFPKRSRWNPLVSSDAEERYIRLEGTIRDTRLPKLSDDKLRQAIEDFWHEVKRGMLRYTQFYDAGDFHSLLNPGNLERLSMHWQDGRIPYIVEEYMEREKRMHDQGSFNEGYKRFIEAAPKNKQRRAIE